MQSGSMAYVEYAGYAGVIHARLLLSLVTGTEWVILTPDHDHRVYPQEVCIRLLLCQPGTMQISWCRAERDNELLNRVMPGPGAGHGPPAVAGGGAGGAVVAGPEAPEEIWVLAEYLDGHKIGEEVFPDAGCAREDQGCLMHLLDEAGKDHVVMAGRVKRSDLEEFCEERIRLARESVSKHGEDTAAADDVRTPGGIIEGMIKPNADRYWNLMMAFEYVCKQPVSSDMIQRLLGHAMVLLVLNRSGMGIFRSLYDFAGQNFKRKMLWGSAVRECKIFSGIIPLLVADMRRSWSSKVFCSDASPDGYGICERSLNEPDVSNIGLWQGWWRYKRSTPEDWCPRERFFRYYRLSDLRSARADPDAMEPTDLYLCKKRRVRGGSKEYLIPR